MSLFEIARDLQSQISQALYVETDELGRHYIPTPFVFGDGDQPVVALVPDQDGWMLSDQGQTLYRLGFQLNDAEHQDPENQRRLDSALDMAGIRPNNGELTKALPPGQYADAVFSFVHALLKIDELGDFPTTVAQSAPRPPRPRFSQEIARLVGEILPVGRYEIGWHHTQFDPNKEYTVDCRINGMPTPLLLHALGNENNTRDATITIYHFQSQSNPGYGRHIGIYRNADEIPKNVRSRFDAVCKETFSNWEQQRSDIANFLAKEIMSTSSDASDFNGTN